MVMRARAISNFTPYNDNDNDENGNPPTTTIVTIMATEIKEVPLTTLIIILSQFGCVIVYVVLIVFLSYSS